MRVNETDMFKIKLSLSSLTNTVILCPVLSSLYTQNSLIDDETWTFLKQGVPGLILVHEDNEVIATQICLADPQTGFAIWRENLIDDSCYKSTQRNFHSFKLLSKTTGHMAGIKFPSDTAANMFLKDVFSSLSRENRIIEVSDSVKEKKKFLRLNNRRIRKDEISKPCLFTHVTSINNRNKVRSQQQAGNNNNRKYRGSGSSLDGPEGEAAPPPQMITNNKNNNNANTLSPKISKKNSMVLSPTQSKKLKKQLSKIDKQANKQANNIMEQSTNTAALGNNSTFSYDNQSMLTIDSSRTSQMSISPEDSPLPSPCSPPSAPRSFSISSAAQLPQGSASFRSMSLSHGSCSPQQVHRTLSSTFKIRQNNNNVVGDGGSTIKRGIYPI